MTGKVDWYVLRSSGVVALVLLTAVTALGIASADRARLAGRPRFVTAALHRSLSLLSVVFVALHVVTTLLDAYAGVSLTAAVVPFTPASNAFWVGVGVVSSDLIIALVLTSLLRQRLGYRAWRATHWLAYASWPAALAHGVGMGSDAASPWFVALSAACLVVVLAAAATRLARRRSGKWLTVEAAR